MAIIDDKVVAMSFENSKFEAGVSKTISSLDRLKAALHFPGAGKGLESINASAKKVDLGHISKGIEDIRAKLGFLSVAALAVFAQIAQRAAAAGTQLVKSLTIGPVIAGLREYTVNLNAIQTILANTQAAGTTLKDVNAALKQLNEYSDRTIYNFSQMAKNIGTFTAAGVDLKTATNAIKGIANLAALSGSNAEQASTAMYQLSQAISAGSLKLQDWNSVVNAGMGGTVFQRALAQTAEAMGTLNKGAVKLTGPMKNVTIAGEAFRQSLSTPGKASWLTSEVLTTTLKQFTGDLKDAELAAMGFNAAQIRSIQQTAKTAMFAATEVKTIGQAFEVAKETAGSGWAETFKIVLGDFGEAKKTFTALSNAVNGFINVNADARNKVLSDWKALGGRTVLITAIKTAFQNLGLVIKPIKQAFRDIFPASTGKSLYDLTVRFSEFTKKLKPSQETMENLRRTFRGVFAIFSIGVQIVKGIFAVFGQLFGVVGDGSGNFLSLTATIGDFLVKIDEALKKGNRLHNFFVGIGKVLAAPLQLLSALGDALADLFAGFSPGAFLGQIGGMSKALSPLQRAMETISVVWKMVLDAIAGSGDMVRPALDGIIEAFQGLGPGISEVISNINFEAILAVIRTGLFAGIFLMFKKFLGGGSLLDQIGQGFGGGIIANISGSFKALEGSMVAMQQNIKAKTLKEIAIAIALLTLSVVALSFVKPERLKSSLAAMTGMFVGLLGAMAIMDKVTSSGGFIKLPFVAASLVILAAAINLLTLSVLALSLLSWEQLIKGLGGVVVLLGAITLAAIPLGANAAGMIRAGVGITAIAVGLLIMATAVTLLAQLSLSELAKGLGGVAVALAIMAGAAKIMPAGMILMGVGLIAVATGLRILAESVEKFGKMEWEVIRKGLIGIGGALLIIATAMHLMPGPMMILTGAGLILVAFALGKIADAVGKMGGMSIQEIAKGLGTLAGSLIILAGALHLMSGTLMGAAALGVAASGLALLAPVLIVLGKQSWTQIIKGTVALAAALGVLGVAALILAPAIPALLGLGAALVVIGAGLALAGAGVFLLGLGLSAIAIAGPTALGIMLAAMEQFIEGMIKNAKLLILGLLEVVRAFAATAPQFVDAMVKILDSLFDVIIKSTPKIIEVVNVLIRAFLSVLATNQVPIIQAGINLIIALLQGIKANIGQLSQLAIEVISKFLGAVASNVGKLVAGGVQIIVAILKGIASGLSRVITAAVSIITRFLGAIGSSAGKIAAAGLNIVVRLLNGISNGIGRIITAGTNLILNFINGIGNAGPRIVAAATNTIIKFINAIQKNANRLAEAGGKAIIAFLNGLANTIETQAPQMRAAGIRVAAAIIDGLTFGLTSKAGALLAKARDLANKLKDTLKKPFDILSPSKVMKDVGQMIVLGLANGLSEDEKAIGAAIAMSQGVITAVENVFQITSPSKVMQAIGKFVGQGFAQGLRGSTEEISSAMANMKKMLTDAMTDARTTIATEQAKLRKLQAEKKKDHAAIREAQKVIALNENILARSTAGHKALVKVLKDNKKELLGLSVEYTKVAEKLKLAEEVLANAIKTRDDAKAGFAAQYGELPEIVKEDAEGQPIDQLAAYTLALTNQIAAEQSYRATLEQLRALGLDDKTYEKLLKEGTVNQAFASQLLAGGKTAVDALNVLDAQLASVSTQLATEAAGNLYQAGVDAAQGLVNGLQSQMKDIEKAMDKIAKLMVKAIKKALKIKSPSEAFAQVGKFSMEGMARGVSISSKKVIDAIDVAAQDALSAMNKTMKGISDVVTDQLDANPVITPILDLSQVEAESQRLASLTNADGSASFRQASAISLGQTALEAEQLAASGGSSVTFEQNNYSPKALTEIEIYRQTRNQLSQVKSSLALT